MTYNRCRDPGWQRIGRIDSSGRRSLWIRESYNKAEMCHVVELCAGREGDDAYVRLTPANPQWFDLDECLTRGRFAAEWEDPDGLTLERENMGPPPAPINVDIDELATDARSLMVAAIQAAQEVPE